MFHDSGKSYSAADYFCTDGPLDDVDEVKNRVVIL